MQSLAAVIDLVVAADTRAKRICERMINNSEHDPASNRDARRAFKIYCDYVQGYVDFHVLSERYRLSEICLWE